MASVVFERVSKSYGKRPPAVRDLSLTVNDRELLVLVGPSGCGKSTALRMIAGLESVTSGSLFIDDRKVNDVAPKDRDVAMVFQSYALYPHMTCYENMAFALTLRRVPRDEIRRRVLAAARALHVEPLLDRKPRELSGGQRQRVAIGRAIVRQPRVFLMDEPLSNLDAKLRSSMRAEIKRLHRELRATIVYVTHDQTEAMTLGGRIAVLREGMLEQLDSPRVVYDAPRTAFVASFIGSPEMNLVAGDLVVERGVGFAMGPGFVLNLGPGSTWKARPVLVGVRPEHLHPTDDPSAPFRGRVELVESTGGDAHVYVTTDAGRLVATVRNGNARLAASELVHLRAERIHLFDRDTEERIA